MEKESHPQMLNLFDLSCCAISVHPTQPHVLYLLAGDGHLEVFKSTDGGAHWAGAVERDPDKRYPLNNHATDLVMDNFPPHALYLCCGGHFGGFYKSVDGGRRWAQYANDSTTFFADTVVIDPIRSDTLYARGAMALRSGDDKEHVRGIFKSLDGGETWTVSYPCQQNTEVEVLVHDPTTSHTVYAGLTSWKVTNGNVEYEGAGIIKSVDGGSTWTSLNSPHLTKTVSMLVLDPTAPHKVYAAMLESRFYQGEGQWEYTWRWVQSDNGGQSWQPLPPAFPTDNFSLLGIDRVHPHQWYICGDKGNFRSLTGGKTWSQMPSHGLPIPSYPQSLAFDPTNPDILYLGTERGGFKSVDGGRHWTPMNEGLFPYYPS